MFKLIPFSVLSFAFLSSIPLLAQDLSVVVKASGAPSRDAHFNWRFESSGGGVVQMGQFACGSYWVAPATGDTGVTVVSLSGKTDDPNWHDFVSCDADPVTENHGLLDGSNNYGSYDPAENIIPDLPLTYSPSIGSCVSLVAAMQRNEAETSNGGTKAIVGEVVDAYCVVTLLPSAPANGGDDMIRPNITGTTKVFLTWDDFDLNRIPVYDFITGKTAAEWERVAETWRHSTEIFGMLTEHPLYTAIKYSEGGRAFRSHLLIPDYGAGMTASFNNSLLAFFSSSTDLDEAKSALAAMLSFGLDIYHARYDYGTGKRKSWSSGAGQSGGQYLPVVFLASLLKDDAVANQIKQIAITNHGEDPLDVGPQELRQQTRGVTGVLLWGDGTPYPRTGNSLTEMEWRYWADMKSSACYDTAVGSCDPNKGKKTAADPYGFIDGPANSPGSAYFSVAFGGVRALAAAMILMPRIRDVVNTDDPIEYADRVVRHGLWTYPDPVAAPTVEDQTNGCTTYWAAEGCSDWGISWGPDPSDIRFAIEGGSGRFPGKHGNLVAKGGYESSRAFDNWATIIGMYDGVRFEDNVVPLGTLVSPEILFAPGTAPKVHLLCPYPDAAIRYTLDGSDPTELSALYEGPFSVSGTPEIRARAYSPGQTPSAVRTRKVGMDVLPPSVPGNLRSDDIRTQEVDLDWEPSSDDFAVSGYRVYLDGMLRLNTVDTEVTITGLVPETAYTFVVSAYDQVGNESNRSNELEITTLPDTSPPSVPIRLGSSAITATTVQLVWYAASDNIGVSGYKVYINGANPVHTSETMIKLTILSPNTLYTFSVSSVDSSQNESAQSKSIQVMTAMGSGETLTWLNYTVDGNGFIDTGNWIGWLDAKRYPWMWSYTVNGWIYAPDPGASASGVWAFMSH